MTSTAGHEYMCAVAAILPYIHDAAKAIRWPGTIVCSTFCRRVLPVLQYLLLTPNASASFVMDERGVQGLRDLLHIGEDTADEGRKREEQIRIEQFLISVFDAAGDGGRLRWDGFLDFLVDAAVSTSARKTASDVMPFLPGPRYPYSLPCNYFCVLSETRAVAVLQQSAQAEPEFQVLGFPSFEVILRRAFGHAVSAATAVPRNQIAVSTELALLFVEMKALREVGKLGYEALESEASCCLVWSQRHQLLFAGGRAGSVWLVKAPQWDSHTCTWTAPCIVSTLSTFRARGNPKVDEPLVCVIPGPTDSLIAAMSSRGTVAIMNTTTLKVEEASEADFGITVLSCAGAHMHFCTGMTYNALSGYLVCCGEAAFLLAWVPRNVSSQPPMRIEDSMNPHASRVMGVTSVPQTTLVASVDNRGLFKIWDLQTLRCIQNIHIEMSQNDYIGIHSASNTIYLSLVKQCFTYHMDDSFLHSTVHSLSPNPKGGSVIAAVGADVIEWNCVNGSTMLHHPKVADGEILSVQYSDNVTSFFTVTKQGQVSSHIAATGKKMMTFQPKNFARSEPLTMVVCNSIRRLVVATVNSDVWVVPFNASHSDVALKYDIAANGGDKSCSCVAVGSVEKAPWFFVGTMEGTVHVLTFRTPNNVRKIDRIGPFEVGEHYCVTALLFSEHSVVVADNTGHLRAVSVPTLKVTAATQLETSTTGPAAANAGASGAVDDYCRLATCMENYIPGRLIVCGDNCGYVSVWALDRRKGVAAPVFEWQAHNTAITCLAVDGERAFTAAQDPPDVRAWQLDGVPLGYLWGDRAARFPMKPPTEPIPKPSWLAPELASRTATLGDVLEVTKSFRLRRTASNAGASPLFPHGRRMSNVAGTTHRKLSESMSSTTNLMEKKESLEEKDEKNPKDIGACVSTSPRELAEFEAFGGTHGVQFQDTLGIEVEGEMTGRTSAATKSSTEQEGTLTPTHVEWRRVDGGSEGKKRGQRRQYCCISNCLGLPVGGRGKEGLKEALTPTPQRLEPPGRRRLPSLSRSERVDNSRPSSHDNGGLPGGGEAVKGRRSMAAVQEGRKRAKLKRTGQTLPHLRATSDAVQLRHESSPKTLPTASSPPKSRKPSFERPPSPKRSVGEYTLACSPSSCGAYIPSDSVM